MNAFALVSRQRIQEFHLWPLNTDTPNGPYRLLLNGLTDEKGSPVFSHHSMLGYSRRNACVKHSNLFKVNGAAWRMGLESCKKIATSPSGTSTGGWKSTSYPSGQEKPDPQKQITTPSSPQTTSVLTTTNLVYAIGAGITAGAGTRLVLQLVLAKLFELHSFLLPDAKTPSISISCHYLPVPGLGNLRACCLP